MLAKKVAASEEPTLTTADLDALLELGARPDGEGRAPSEAGWVATYDLDAAALEGWLWKAGRAAPAFGVQLDDGQRAERHQVHAHCLQMAENHRRRLSGSARLTSRLADEGGE